MDGKRVLVVTVRSPLEADVMTGLRDYIMDSVEQGVLVLMAGMEYRVEELPPLGGVEVRRPAPKESEVLRGEKPEIKTSSKAAREREQKFREAAEKMEICDRLKAYRREHGLGCLNQLAMKCGGGGITADVLRDAVNGSAVLPLTSWRRIGKALKKVEVGHEGN